MPLRFGKICKYCVYFSCKLRNHMDKEGASNSFLYSFKGFERAVFDLDTVNRLAVRGGKCPCQPLNMAMI